MRACEMAAVTVACSGHAGTAVRMLCLQETNLCSIKCMASTT